MVEPITLPVVRIERGKRETGWLIESQDAQGAPMYFTLRPGSERDWTNDSEEALRFARAQDAHDFAGLHLDSDGPPCRVVEHIWQ